MKKNYRFKTTLSKLCEAQNGYQVAYLTLSNYMIGIKNLISKYGICLISEEVQSTFNKSEKVDLIKYLRTA